MILSEEALKDLMFAFVLSLFLGIWNVYAPSTI